MSNRAKNRLWFFVIFLAGSSIGFIVGAWGGGYFGMSQVINNALARDAAGVETQLRALRLLRNGDTGAAIELLEAGIDDTLVVFDPAEPYPGVADATAAAVDAAIEKTYRYRLDYPRKSERPHVDAMIENLFERRKTTP